MNERAIKPLSPSEILVEQKNSIPDFVIESVNALLKQHVSMGHATIRQDDIIAEIIKHYPSTSRQMIFNNGWLNFESLYEDAGWEVSYDRPGYNETYAATFDFKDKRKE